MPYAPVGITAGASSFDIAPSTSLNPDLFDGQRLKPDVRAFLLGTIGNFMTAKYAGTTTWLKVWLAGSGASYRWNAGHDLLDLDVLLGVDFIKFRSANRDYLGLSDNEIASMLNDQMRQELWPLTKHWRDRYEVTWYVNAKSQDIRNINPYAAYDVSNDLWTVPPSQRAPEVNPEWELYAGAYRQRAEAAVAQYSHSLAELQSATNPVHRINAERYFNQSVEQASSLFENVHKGRKAAFSTVGKGYDDFANFLWQAGKRDGWIEALRMISDYRKQALSAQQVQTYGIELPDTSTLIRRAAMYRRV
jgi:hypothetical protein